MAILTTVTTPAHTWTVNSDTTAPTTGDLADPLVWHSGPPLAPGWTTREVPTCTFAIIGNTADLHDLDIGTRVSVTVDTDPVATTPTVDLFAFHGTVMEITAEPAGPHHRFTVYAVDNRRLLDIDVDHPGFPAGTAEDRWRRLADIANDTLPVTVSPSISSTPNAGRTLSARPAGRENLSAMMAETLLDASDQAVHLILYSSNPGVIDVIQQTMPMDNPTVLTLTALAGPVYALVYAPPAPPAQHVRDACEFHLSIDYARRWPSEVTRATLTTDTYQLTTPAVLTGSELVTYTRPTTIATPADAAAAAGLHTSGTHHAGGAWSPDVVTWFPMRRATGVGGHVIPWVSPQRPLVIVDTVDNLPGATFPIVAGMVREATVTLAAGDVTVQYTLDPLMTPRNSLVWSDTILGAVTPDWTQLADTDTWVDYLLATA